MSRQARTWTILGCSLAALWLAGCGSNLAGRVSNIPDDVRSVYIEPLGNETARAQVEQILTQAVAQEMVKRRRFTVVNGAAEADAIIRGRVLSFQVQPLAFDPDGLANNFQIVITADMKFERPPRGLADEAEVIWSNSHYVFREDYPLEDPTIGYFDRENLAIRETSIRFAETMVTDLLEGF